MADTCSLAFYDDSLYLLPFQREYVHHVDVRVQVSSSIPSLGLVVTIYLSTHSSCTLPILGVIPRHLYAVLKSDIERSWPIFLTRLTPRHHGRASGTHYHGVDGVDMVRLLSCCEHTCDARQWYASSILKWSPSWFGPTKQGFLR